MRRWGTATSSCVVRSRVCGAICPLTRRDMMTTSMRFALSLALAALLVAAAPGVFTAQQAPPVTPAAGAEAHLATVKQYCSGCHNDRSKMAGVSFEGLTADAIAKHPDLFEKAVRKMRGRVMPPPSARQPAPAAVDSLVAWLEASLDRAANPAYLRDDVELHRLNRKE